VAPNATKTYDGTTIQQPTTSDLTALSAQLVGGDRVSSAAITFGNASAGGNKTVTLNSVVVSDDNSGQNYRISVTDAYGGVINKANLTVSAVNDGKIVTQADSSSVNGSIGFGGVIYSGFVGGETAANLTSTANGSVQALWNGTVTRANISGVDNESARTYENVLTPSGFSATNYNISYQTGSYTIVPVDTLLVKVVGSGTASVNYSSNVSSHQLSTQYVHNNVTISTPGIAVNGYASINDGAGGFAIFNLNAVNGSYSSSGNLNVGGYNLNASNVTIIGNNFNSMVVVGAMTVLPKQLTNNVSTIQSVSKVYDGSTSITAANLTFNQSASGVVSGDVVSLVGSGSFVDRHVASNKSVTLSMGLLGADANNYVLSNGNLTANIGTISQLASVVYTGANNGSWSTATNWVGGALPDGNNVAQVIIPINKTVVYNSDQVGITGSSILNNGSIVFASANTFNLTNTISGAGNISQRGIGTLNITGNNSMSGTVDITNYSLALGNANALGSATVVADGGNLSIGSGIVLPSLNTSGNINLISDVNISNAFTANGLVNALGNITTGGNLTANSGIAANGLVNVGANILVNGSSVFAGDVNAVGNITLNGNSSLNGLVNSGGNQFYGGAVTFTSSGALTTANTAAVSNFISTGGNISFNSTVNAGNGSAATNRSLVISATNGTVLFNDQVGQNVIRLRSAEIETIPYTSYGHMDVSPYALKVGARTIKLFGDISTFASQEYIGSVLVGNNGSNGNIRLMLSMDPSITINGPINDVVAGQDTLVLRAIRLPNDPATPTISLGDVGLTTPLAGLNILVGEQNTIQNNASVAQIRTSRFDYVGTINLGGSVSTIGNQMYVGNNISLTGTNNLISQLGTIEMVTGLTNGSISGLSNANFILGTNANLGSSLAALGANITRLPPEVSAVAGTAPQDANNAVLLAQNNLVSFSRSTVPTSPHGVYLDRAQQSIQATMEMARDTSMSAGEVLVSDVYDAVCLPKAGDSCDTP
jgi:hypothetical protein